LTNYNYSYHFYSNIVHLYRGLRRIRSRRFDKAPRSNRTDIYTWTWTRRYHSGHHFDTRYCRIRS